LQDFDAAVAPDHNIEWLAATMGDARGVGGGHAFGDPDGDIEQVFHRQRARSSTAAKASPAANPVTVYATQAQHIWDGLRAAAARASCSERALRPGSFDTSACGILMVPPRPNG
jgi:hypothetical protein